MGPEHRPCTENFLVPLQGCPYFLFSSVPSLLPRQPAWTYLESEDSVSEMAELDAGIDFLTARGGFMNPAVVLRVRAEGNGFRQLAASVHPAPGRPAVLIATVDPEIREGLANLLEITSVNAIWVSSVEDVKALVARERIVACLCGFWLQDGTYREVVQHLRRERINVPAIIVSAPACPQEYRDILAAMNLGALDFLPYPYQLSDFERMLGSVIAANSRWKHEQSSGNGHDLRERGAA